MLEYNYYDISFERPKDFYANGQIVPDYNQFIWLVCEGVVKLNRISKNSEEVILGFAGPQMVFGSSLTSLPTYLATAFSKNVQLACISLSEIAASSDLAQAILPKIIRRLQQTECFLAIYGQRRVLDRLQNLLLLLKQEFGQPVAQGTRLQLRLTHNQLASACGTTRVTMTRLLGKLQEEGKITFDRNYRITLRDREIPQKSVAYRENTGA